jgi:hypothetical protein
MAASAQIYEFNHLIATTLASVLAVAETAIKSQCRTICILLPTMHEGASVPASGNVECVCVAEMQGVSHSIDNDHYECLQ